MNTDPTPIAYAYQADWHCPDCAERAHGRCPDGWIACPDHWSRSDDQPGALFGWDSWHSCDDYSLDFEQPGPAVCAATLICGTCGTHIDYCGVAL